VVLPEHRVEGSVKGGSVSFRALNCALAVGLAVTGWLAASPSLALGQEAIHRKVKIKVAPVYPQLAKRMHISGVVKIEVTVAANGSIKNATVLGGHPVLANAALDAVRKWLFEAGPQESSGIVEIRFDPGQ
jgi:TonB family protein